jgi:translation initiation factor eIF-2B subunit delta
MEPKQVGLFFGHLYSQPRQHSIAGATKEVHPAILALGLQYSSYVVCGSIARMVSMLLAFKAVSYTIGVQTLQD